MKIFTILLPALALSATCHALLSPAYESAFAFAVLLFLITTLTIFLLIKTKETTKKYIFTTIPILFVLFLLSTPSKIEQSFYSALIPLIDRWNEAYDVSFTFDSLLPDTSPTMALYAFFAFLWYIGTLSAFSPFIRIFASIIGFFSILFNFYFAIEPPILDILLITAFGIGLIADKKSQIFISTISLLIGSILFFLYPTKSYHQPAFLSTWQEAFLSITDPALSLFHGGHAFATINAGSDEEKKLGHVDGIHFTGRTVVNIQTEEVEHPLYIRHTIGAIYKDNHWDELPDNAYENTSPLFDKNQGEWYDQSAWLMEVISHNAELTSLYNQYLPSNAPLSTRKRNFSISDVYGKTSYYFIPYHASFGSDIFIYDRAPKGNKQKIYSTYLWQIPTGSALSFLGNTTSSDPYFLTYAAGEKLYKKFVYKHYLTVPEKIRASINGIFPLSQATTLKEKYQKVEDIRHFFSSHYTYTTHPGKTPEGNDFINYFLTEQKEGYCTYFASAGVMLLRASGIPARYVTGLYVSEKDLLKSPALDGVHHISVSDRHSHAWAEVYVDGIGWEPCEFTPGQGNGENPFQPPTPKLSDKQKTPPTQNTQNKQKEQKNEPQKKPQKEQEKNSQQNEKPQQKSSSSNQLKNLPVPQKPVIPTKKSSISSIVYPIFVLLFIFLISIYFLNRRIKYVPRMLHQALDNEKYFAASIPYMLRLTSRYGYPLKESYDTWCHTVNQDERFSGFDTWLNLIMKSKFNETPLTMEERKIAINIIKNIRMQLLSSQTKKERFLFRYVYKL